MPTARARTGSRGEAIARRYLETKGYLILETNYRCQWGEMDIVTRDGECLAFVEVRTRRSDSYGTPEESLSRRKQQKLVATAETYLQAQAKLPPAWRIDLLCVVLDQAGTVRRVEHLENVIELT